MISWDNYVFPPFLLVLFVFYRIYQSSSATIKINHHASNKKDQSIELLPITPVTTIQLIKARFGTDYTLKSLAWCRQINSPVYQLVTKIYILIHTNDVNLFRQVLMDPTTTKPSDYKVFQDMHDGGEDILSSDGLFWKHSRKGIAPAFSKMHLTRMTRVVEEQVEEFIKKQVRPMILDDRSMDVCQEMVQLTLRVICQAAFEYTMSDEEQHLVRHGFNVALKEGIKTLVYPLRSKVGLYLFRESKDAHEASLQLVELGFKILKSYRSMTNPTEGTLIDRIAKNTNYDSDKDRVNDILILLFAGHDTTAYSISWTLLELAKKPEEQRLLREELQKHPREDWTHLKRLKFVVKEGMRIHPFAPLQMRLTGRELNKVSSWNQPKTPRIKYFSTSSFLVHGKRDRRRKII